MNYHDRPEMSQSKMKVLLDSPRLYYLKYILKEQIDSDKPSPSKQFGNCLDAALTEPELYATFKIKDSATTQITNCTTIEWNKKIQKMIVDLDDYCIDDDFFGGYCFRIIKQSCKNQVETYYNYYDIDWRMKTDYESINDDFPFFIDIKSTRATTYDDFIKDFYKFRYYLQAASYSQGLKTKHNLNRLPPAYYIAISSITGEIFAIRCSDEIIQLGLIELEYGCGLYHHMMKNEGWCKNQKIKTLYAPQWMQNKIITLGEKNYD